MRHLLKAFLAVLVIAGTAGVFHPDSPLPDEWNPFQPLRITASLGPLTDWKLRAALADDEQCRKVLRENAQYSDQPPLFDSPQCYIKPRIALSQLGQTKLHPLDTRCQTALRLAMWEQHGLQTAALRHLGSAVREIRHYSSYSCRPIRTSAGNDTKMSTHATANAIDVSGFVLENGDAIDLKQDWLRIGPKSDFLRDAFHSACLWFPVALGPEFNALHADHFHLQTRGWGLCR